MLVLSTACRVLFLLISHVTSLWSYWTEQGNSTTQWTTYDELQQLNQSMSFAPLTDANCIRLENAAQTQFNDRALDRKVCVIKDTWIFPKDAQLILVDELPFDAMRAVLTGQPWATPSITQYYDCSHIDSRLRGLLLSQRAFVRNKDGKLCVWISVDALHALRTVATRLDHTTTTPAVLKPPKFAIADCFVAGAYAKIERLNFIECQAVGLAQIRGLIKVVYGGPGNVLQSHLLCWDNRDATIASQIPNVVGRDSFQLILAGPMTTAQELLLAKRHECDSSRVREAHKLLRQINPLYAGIKDNKRFPTQRQDCHAFCTRLDDDDETGELVAQARARQSTVARMHDEEQDTDRRECTIVESQTVLMETVTDRTEHDRLATAFANVTGTANDASFVARRSPARLNTDSRYVERQRQDCDAFGTRLDDTETVTDRTEHDRLETAFTNVTGTGNDASFVARRSPALLKNTDLRYVERLFPHLLTFGIGGFSMNRHHRYGQHAIVVHYLNLSTNRFAEDSIFKLAMFDHLSTMRVKTGVFLRIGQDPALATTVMKISPAQLKTAMSNRENQRKAWKQGKTFVPIAEASLATRVLKSINATTSKMWGSNEERWQ